MFDTVVSNGPRAMGSLGHTHGINRTDYDGLGKSQPEPLSK